MKSVQIREYASDTAPVRGRTLAECRGADLGVTEWVRHVLDPESSVNIRPEAALSSLTVLDKLQRSNLADPTRLEAWLRSSVDMALTLRHAGAIAAEDAQRWLLSVATSDPARLQWHIKRLDGVSASSAYAYIAESMGKRSLFTTAHELDSGRLMRTLPVETTPAMFRGTVMEEVIRRVFFERNGHQYRPDDQALVAAQSLRGTPKFPWLIGNPDSIIRDIRHPKSPRFIQDFKCPTQPLDPDDPAMMEYKVQLHIYGILSGAAGHPVNGLALTHLHLAPDLARYWSEMVDEDPSAIDLIVPQVHRLLDRQHEFAQFMTREVKIDPALVQQIVLACDAADRRVQMGQVAPWPKKHAVELSEQQSMTVANLQKPFLRLSLLRAAVEEQRDHAIEAARAHFDGVDPRGASIGTLVKLTSRGDFDTDRAAEYLRSVGVPEADLYRTETRQIPHKPAILKLLAAREVPEEVFTQRNLSLAPVQERYLKEADRDGYSVTKEEMKRLVSSICPEHLIPVPDPAVSDAAEALTHRLGFAENH